MTRLPASLAVLVLALAVLPNEHAAIAALDQVPQMEWTALPPLPNQEGLAGLFAGVASGALLVAGGANFPEKKPWEGGVKVWHDSVFVLEPSSREWRLAGKLARPLAYGVSMTTRHGVVCAGGSDARRHYAEVFVLELRDGKVQQRGLPAMPQACANMSGAVVGNTLYVAGGTVSPEAANALRTFWSLDLADERAPWQVLEPWPGPARMLAVAASYEGAFYLFSGVDVSAEAGGKPVRKYLSDAFCYRPGRGWKGLPQLPRAAAAAPSPAPVMVSHILLISGDDGTNLNFEPKSQHPGFPGDVLAFNLRKGTWEHMGDFRLSRATVPVLEWRGQFVIPSGEVRPGVRSPEVWALSAKNRKVTPP